jgi:hypothetical protein
MNPLTQLFLMSTLALNVPDYDHFRFGRIDLLLRRRGSYNYIRSSWRPLAVEAIIWRGNIDRLLDATSYVDDSLEYE